MLRYFHLVLIGFFFITSCIKPIEEVPPTTPPMVESLSFDPEKNEFSGKVNAIGDGIKDHGFVWSLVITTPTLEDSEKKSLGTKSQLGNFTVQVDSFPEGANLTARAYMTDIYDRNFYGNVLSIQIEERIIELNTNAYQVNQQDQFTGTIQGQVTKFSNNKIVDHGHCWGLGLPTIDSAHSSLTFPSSTNPPYTFTSQLDSGAYSHGITYQIRSYAKDEKGSVFYGNVQTFKIQDFWEQMSTPAGFWGEGPAFVKYKVWDFDEGDVVVIRDKCENFPNIFWVYNFTTSQWKTFSDSDTPFSLYENTEGSITFTINNQPYFGAGKPCPSYQGSFSPVFLRYWENFWEEDWDADRSTGPWSISSSGDTVAGSFDRQNILAFSGGISAVINGKVYMGLGEVNTNGGSLSVPRLIEYDPTLTDDFAWNVLSYTNKSFVGAIGFNLKGKLYYGLGMEIDPSHSLAEQCSHRIDIYDPLTQSSSHLFFPDGPRIGATAFVIADKAYIGMGVEGDIDFQGNCRVGAMRTDLKRFNPDNTMNTYIEMAPYPGSVVPSYHFIWNNIAFVGSGNEIWRYYPDLE